MKILYITSMLYKKGSSASIRNVALVNGLVESGCDVEVCTVLYPESVKDSFLVNETSSSVMVHEIEAGYVSRFVPSAGVAVDGQAVGLSYPMFKRKVRSLVKDLIFFPDVDSPWVKQDLSLFKSENYDLVVSSSDSKTSHFVAQKLLKMMPSKIHWAQIWGDPWFGDVGEMSPLKRFRAKKSEKKLLECADSVHYVSLPTRDWMADCYKKLASKMFYLPRGFLSEVRSVKEEVSSIKKFVYTGVLAGRNLKPLLSVIEEENAKKGCSVEFEFYGRITSEELVFLERYPFFKYMGLVDLEGVYSAYEAADVLVFLGNAKGTTQIPGKLYDYFGTNKCVLALVEDIEEPVARFIDSTNRCILFENKVAQIDMALILNDLDGWSSVLSYSPKTLALELKKQVAKI